MVSLVIPTYRRVPDLMLAVQSALDQTYRDMEVLVVADGPDAEARSAVEALEVRDARVRYIELEVNSGPAQARNAGVRVSRGEWLAFLDDDDSMLPLRIERQMGVADAARPQRMIACRSIYRHDKRDDVWPLRPIGAKEDIADYLLLRPSLLGRPGVVTLQSLLVHRSLLEKVPFVTQNDHEDWAWLLEAWHVAGARIEFVWEPLVVYNIVTQSISRSRRMNWKDSMAWAEQYRGWIGDAAYNSFMVTKVALKARRAGDWRGLRTIARAVLKSKPRVLDLMFLAGVMGLPGCVLHAAWKRSLASSEGV